MTRASADLDRRELVAVVPLIAALVFFGFFPQPMLDAVNPTVDSLLHHVGVTDDPPTVPIAEPDDASEEGH